MTEKQLILQSKPSTVVISCIILLLSIPAMVVHCQWSQFGYDTAQSFMSPYNYGSSVSGVCTQWTSSVVSYNMSMKSTSIFPLLQTYDSRYIIYRNAALKTDGKLLMKWDLSNTGYAVAYYHNISNDQEVLFTLHIDEQNSYYIGAYRFSASMKRSYGLEKLWICDTLRFSSKYQVLLDEEYSENLLVYTQSAGQSPSVAVTAINIRNGFIKWKRIFQSYSRKRIAASKGIVFVAYDSGLSALNTTDGSVIWTTNPPTVRKLFTVIEDKNTLVVSHSVNSIYFLAGYDVMNGHKLWSQQSYFGSLPNNTDITNLSQSKSEYCDIEMLVERSDGIYTTCTVTSGSLTSGRYWTGSKPSVEFDTTTMLSLGNPTKNLIVTGASAPRNEISVFKSYNSRPSRCTLIDYSWEVAIQDRNKNIIVAIESLRKPEFRLILLTTSNCKIFPNCPYFETTEQPMFKVYVIAACSALAVLFCCSCICLCVCIRCRFCGILDKCCGCCTRCMPYLYWDGEDYFNCLFGCCCKRQFNLYDSMDEDLAFSNMNQISFYGAPDYDSDDAAEYVFVPSGLSNNNDTNNK